MHITAGVSPKNIHVTHAKRLKGKYPGRSKRSVHRQRVTVASKGLRIAVQLRYRAFGRLTSEQVKKILICSVEEKLDRIPVRVLYSGTYGNITPAANPGFSGLPKTVIKHNIYPILGKQLMDEARIQFQLHHPCILPCYGYAAYTGSTLMLLPKANESLHKRLSRIHKKINSMEWKSRYSICRDIAEGLIYLHSKNLVHGDIKSRNILLTADDRALVADFGDAVNCGTQNLTTEILEDGDSHTFRGTKVNRALQAGDLYRAPEAFSGSSIHAGADVYGWGLILFGLLYGDNVMRSWSNHPHCRLHLCSSRCPHITWPDTGSKPLHSIVQQKQMLRIDSGLDLPARRHSRHLRKFMNLAITCIELNPEKRESCMTQVLRQADTLQKEFDALPTSRAFLSKPLIQ